MVTPGWERGYRPGMTFDVGPDDYASFMGRYADPLAELFVGQVLGDRDRWDLGPGDLVLDVGCGPGTVTAVLVERLGADRVAAVDPSPSFAAAVRSRFPNVDVRDAVAEDLPFPDGQFGVALAQLVVPFMADPLRGLGEMGRVVRSGGRVAACAWDVSRGPIAPFWQVARELDPTASGATDRPGAREGQLAAMLEAAGLSDAWSTTATVSVDVATFEEWWTPFAFGIGTAGEYFVSLTSDQQQVLKERCRASLTDEPIRISGTAHIAVAVRR